MIPMKEVSILDWSWYVFRAYYGMPALTNEQWQPVQAIIGFFKMVLSLWKESPDHFCIAWDSPWPTLRKQKVESYKAQRVKQPDEFIWQMRTIKTLVEAIGIPHQEMPWYEADDIIASLVRHKAKDDMYTIVSSDKDLKQLVSSTVTHYDAMKNKRTSPQDFIDEYGFEPQYMGEYLALIGDASDNIPWVPWIWPKAATTLIQRYKTLQAIYDHIDSIHGTLKEKLVAGKESARQSHELIQLYDIPQSVPNIQQLHRQPNIPILKDILVEQWKFKSLVWIINDLDHQQRQGVQGSLF
jgi:5'-3' exonuclease